MAITFYMHNPNLCEVTIRGEKWEFNADLQRFKDTVPRRDREWDSEEKVWWLKNPHDYTKFFPKLLTAWNNHQAQGTIFELLEGETDGDS